MEQKQYIKMLEDLALCGDCERCHNCKQVRDTSDLKAIGDHKFCEDCFDAAEKEAEEEEEETEWHNLNADNMRCGRPCTPFPTRRW
jgi:hypothetical protein